MEVHSHSHTPRKKWTHYFWEFLMLFLAVFCGFLAEYQLEHKIEKERGRQYINSMIDDLQQDTVMLASVISGYDRIGYRFDTLFKLYGGITHGYNDTLWRSFPSGFPDFVKSNKTMQQLLFSGGLRLIKKRKAADAILDYDLKNDDLDIDINSLRDIYRDVTASSWALLNRMELDQDKNTMSLAQLKAGGKNYLLRTDKAFLGNYYNELKLFQALCKMVSKREKNLMDKASALILLLKEEYHLQ